MRKSRIRTSSNSPRIIGFADSTRQGSKRAFSELKSIYERELENKKSTRKIDSSLIQELSEDEKNSIQIRVKKQLIKSRRKEWFTSILKSIFLLAIIFLIYYLLKK